METAHLYQTIKIWRRTLSKLRLLAGVEEKSIVRLIDDLVTKALKEKDLHDYAR